MYYYNIVVAKKLKVLCLALKKQDRDTDIPMGFLRRHVCINGNKWSDS